MNRLFTWCAPTEADEILVATAVATVQHAINDVVLFLPNISQQKTETNGVGWVGGLRHTRGGGIPTIIMSGVIFKDPRYQA